MSTDITTLIVQHEKSTRPLRVATERSIIGAILIEPHAMGKVMDILSVKNFTDMHRLMYQACLDLYTDAPIDLRTVHQRMLHLCDTENHYKIYKDKLMAYELANCTLGVNSSANIESHSLMLVELSIIDQMINIYTDAPKHNLMTAMAHEIITDLISSDDKLQVIESAADWLEKTLPDDIYTKAVTQLNASINAKATKIKNRERLRILIKSLTEYSVNRQDKPVIEKLTQILINTINQGSPGVDFINDVYHLAAYFSPKKQTTE